MLQELEDLGLSEKEGKVYLAALEIGRATADQLAKHANIVRPTTYVQIKSLMEMGLMSTYEEGKKTYFAPESPSALTRLLEKKKEALRTSESLLSIMLPDLTRQFEGAGERPVVRFFPGKEGVTALRELALNGKDKEHRGIYSYEGLSEIYSYEERKEYTNRRLAKGISVRAIVSTLEDEMVSGFEKTKLLPVPAHELPMDIEIRIWDKNVEIVLYKGDPFGILIESPEVATSFQSVFDLFWKNLAQKYEVKE